MSTWVASLQQTVEESGCDLWYWQKKSPLDWLSFWDSFQAAIHLNPNLSGIQKFNYLKSQLQGDAARCIDGIPLSDQNYLHAVTLLQDHFRQTHKLVSAHMQTFIESPNPTNTLNSLRKFMTQYSTSGELFA